METLSTLMKNHEHKHRRTLPRGEYQLIRLDGRAFHTYTKGLDRPFDREFSEAMEETMLFLCNEIQGVRVGYVQSDEISLLITDWKTVEPSDSNPDGVQQGQLWMGGIEAKIISLSAAMATAKFNEIRNRQKAGPNGKRIAKTLPIFDARVWTFEGTPEGESLVKRYFFWRRADAFKNAVTMAALAQFSHKELHKKHTDDKIEMLAGTKFDVEALESRFKFGLIASRESFDADVTYTRRDTGEVKTTRVRRTRWISRPFDEFATFWTSDTLPKPLREG